MRVQKIIQAYPNIFNVEQNADYSEMEAILKVASMDCLGNELQKEDFRIRQTHAAICNLLSLGFRTVAVELAIELIPKAEIAQNYVVAQDLCSHLIAHFYQLGDLDSVHLYRSLYDLFTLNIANEHSSMLLFGTAIHNHQTIKEVDTEEVTTLINLIKQNLPFDPLWYRYYYFQFSSFLKDGTALEQVYLAAFDYFENLHLRHTSFIIPFYEGLLKYYLTANEVEKAENLVSFLEPGSISWFKNYLLLVKALLEKSDIKSNDLCILTMNHPNFIELPGHLKEEWKFVYKASVRVLLDYN